MTTYENINMTLVVYYMVASNSFDVCYGISWQLWYKYIFCSYCCQSKYNEMYSTFIYDLKIKAPKIIETT